MTLPDMPLPESEYVSSIWRDGMFNGTVVFVTGGAGTICSAQTRAMVRLGADACIVGRRTAETEAAARDIATARKGAKVLAAAGCDVRDFESVKGAVDRCVRELGGIDFVIAGAAGNFIAPLSSMTTNAFRAVVDIDLVGSFNTARATLPHLARARPYGGTTLPAVAAAGSVPLLAGRIVFVSATFHYTGLPLQAHMAAAKAGVDSLMASIALEYGPRGVTSNAVAPGPIENTEGMARLAGQTGTAGPAAADAGRAAAARRAVPVGRWGTVRDIADATVFIFSEAGSFVNGLAMAVDGGAWRRQAGGISVGVEEGATYPDFLLGNGKARL